MKKFLQIIAIAALFVLAASMTSCTTDSTQRVVQFNNGQRVWVAAALYDIGDTVCVETTYFSATGSTCNKVSTSRWATFDTEWTDFSDSTFMASSWRMGVIVE